MNEPAVYPGGYIFIPLDLFASANDEAEFAGMVSQAMARGLRQGATGPMFYGSLNNLPIRIPAGPRDSIRAWELQADADAAPAMARAGFDPTALLRYIERTQTKPENAAVGAFSTLPPRDERIAALQGLLRNLPPTSSPSSEAFTSIQEQARAQRAGDPRPTLARP